MGIDVLDVGIGDRVRTWFGWGNVQAVVKRQHDSWNYEWYLLVKLVKYDRPHYFAPTEIFCRRRSVFDVARG